MKRINSQTDSANDGCSRFRTEWDISRIRGLSLRLLLVLTVALVSVHDASGQVNSAQCAYSPMIHIGPDDDDYLYFGERFDCPSTGNTDDECHEVSPIVVSIACNYGSCGYGLQHCHGVPPANCFALSVNLPSVAFLAGLNTSLRTPFPSSVKRTIPTNLNNGDVYRNRFDTFNRGVMKIRKPGASGEYIFVKLAELKHRTVTRAIMRLGIEIDAPVTPIPQETPARLVTAMGINPDGIREDVPIRGLLAVKRDNHEYIVRLRDTSSGLFHATLANRRVPFSVDGYAYPNASPNGIPRGAIQPIAMTEVEQLRLEVQEILKQVRQLKDELRRSNEPTADRQ